MKSEDLLKYMGSVDDKYVDELMTESIRTSRRRVSTRRTILSVAASLAIIILAAALLFTGTSPIGSGSVTLTNGVIDVPMAHNSIIMIDVNPSIQLEVNDRNQAVSAVGLNDESKAAIDGVQVAGKEYTAAVTDIVSALQQKGYVTDLKNSVLISVESDDEAASKTMLDASVAAVQQYGGTLGYGLSVLGQMITPNADESAKAAQYGISEGRADLIDKFISAHSDYSFDTLVKSNIQLLNQLFQYAGLPEGVERVGDVAGVIPQESAQELHLTELSGDELLSFTEAVSDLYNKLSEYYDPAGVAQRIGYDLKIVEGSTTDGKRLWTVFVESLTKDVADRAAIINEGKNTVSDWLSRSEAGRFIESIRSRLDGR